MEINIKLAKILLVSLITTSSVFAQSNTVYILDKAKKYHRGNSRTLRKHPISIQEAKKEDIQYA
ncbi:hypothetical protein [Brachyspira sp. SAP_772]|uniref:hypothetical protein n=1 Tax=Brachyspira sp. SAP_772 TaxID=2608385 RepID=UPI001E28DFA5|nr:hypothetical protein [Brachyspira sp. SAP_772]